MISGKALPSQASGACIGASDSGILVITRRPAVGCCAICLLIRGMLRLWPSLRQLTAEKLAVIVKGCVNRMNSSATTRQDELSLAKVSPSQVQLLSFPRPLMPPDQQQEHETRGRSPRRRSEGR
jgi:hypothetical protein